MGEYNTLIYEALNMSVKYCLGKPREHCGVIGVYSPDKSIQVSRYAFDGLIALQHRGQESAGIYVQNGKGITGHKDMGLASTVFTKKILSTLYGNKAIAHVRYSTTSDSNIENAQPKKFVSTLGSYAIAFNGTITNFLKLRSMLEEKGHVFHTDSDTETIAHVLAANLLETDDYTQAIFKSMNELKGSYSMVILNEKGDLYAVRDPLGFKPLCIGQINNIYMVASETAAIESLNGTVLGDVAPGEVIRITDSGPVKEGAIKAERHARCMFEYVYFSRTDSRFDGISIYRVRERLGKILAQIHPVEADIIVPVPDSGRTAAAGLAAESGIPMVEGLIKNRYVWRTFIMPVQAEREDQVKLKLNPVRELISGRDVVLVDDSIVRATTMKRIVCLIRNAGANKVHVRVSCPPIIAPCYMGIDFPTSRELIAANQTIEEIRKFIGADSLGYMTIDGLMEGIGLPENELCLACLNKKYPIETVDTDFLEKYLGGPKRVED
ncbi:MAG: amidophosphoribosyltransferase [Candidatus Jordarchaeaceae archaeon]